LFIDDLDKARFSPRVASELFDVIEARELNYLPVVITTNASGKELAAKFEKTIGPAVVNRLARMSITIDFDDRHFDFDEELSTVQVEVMKEAQQQAEIVEEIKTRRAEAERIKEEARLQVDAGGVASVSDLRKSRFTAMREAVSS
jgi:hypothetical protein